MDRRGIVTMYFSVAICSLWRPLVLAAVLKSSSASSPAVYDQRQNGDYNVRLHLKDFQIVALLNEETLSSLADDYEELDYQIPEEYLDVPLPTVSNATSTTTSTTIADPSTANITKVTQETSTTPITQPLRRTVTSRITVRSTTPKQEQEFDSQTTPFSFTAKPSLSIKSEIQETPNTNDNNAAHMDDRIPVIVVQEKSSRNSNNNTRRIVSTSVTIVPSSNDSARKESQIVLGEIVQLKRCPQGYSRDKVGRCRRTSKPQLPFDISRLSSNLASRFKRPASTEKS